MPSKNNFRNHRNNPYLLDDLAFNIHRSAAGVIWRLRAELVTLISAASAFLALDYVLAITWTAIVLGAVVLVTVALPWPRRFITRRAWCVISRHRMQRVFFETRMHTRSGRLSLILRIHPTEVGERALIWCRAGICFEDFEAHTGEIAAACYARRLSVPIVQAFLNGKRAEGKSVRNVHVMRQVLSAALTRAVREELIPRNVARLAELPAWEPGDVQPWSADEAMAFLRAAKDDLLYPAFVLLILYGMRRGEVLGLRWQDIDLEAGKFRIRQQIQRVGGQLRLGPVKTKAGNRDLPIPELARTALLIRHQQQATDKEAFGRAWADTGLVFTTRSGLPVEPRNLVRSFRRICDRSKIRLIKVHHLRHTTASLLKQLRVPARDAQAILGHAHVSTTMQIYTHVDEQARDVALMDLGKLLSSSD